MSPLGSSEADFDPLDEEVSPSKVIINHKTKRNEHEHETNIIKINVIRFLFAYYDLGYIIRHYEFCVPMIENHLIKLLMYNLHLECSLEGECKRTFQALNGP